jgi:hypothetical protein
MEEGEFGEWRMSLRINDLNQSRIDFIAYPAAPDLNSFSYMGNYKDAEEKFYNAVNNWVLNECPPIVRFAYGVVLINEVPDKKNGYEMLAAYLPFIKFDVNNWTDFTFQVNSKTTSTAIAGLELNRVSKWNSIRMINLGLDGSRREKNACRIELDLSTGAENEELIDSKKFSEIYLELREVADKFVLKGVPE